jgi:hypothetical protein
MCRCSLVVADAVLFCDMRAGGSMYAMPIARACESSLREVQPGSHILADAGWTRQELWTRVQLSACRGTLPFQTWAHILSRRRAGSYVCSRTGAWWSFRDRASMHASRARLLRFLPSKTSASLMAVSTKRMSIPGVPRRVVAKAPRSVTQSHQCRGPTPLS